MRRQLPWWLTSSPLFGLLAQLSVVPMSLQNKHGRLPRPHNAEEAAALLSVAKELAQQASVQLEEPVVEQLAYTAAGHLNPMAAMMGGIVGQVGKLPEHATREPSSAKLSACLGAVIAKECAQLARETHS